MRTLFFSVMFLVATGMYAQETKSDTIKKKVTVLDEVKVNIKKKFIKVESDKTTVSVKDNAMLNSGSSLEAVKNYPV